ncbi:hypothetical protein KCP73_13115 [Salmonella enterica subsp. enterica]|nr:hypothetical protein KCP73_13115 [Salmonella enterica subsp. enterica]
MAGCWSCRGLTYRAPYFAGGWVGVPMVAARLRSVIATVERRLGIPFSDVRFGWGSRSMGSDGDLSRMWTTEAGVRVMFLRKSAICYSSALIVIVCLPCSNVSAFKKQHNADSVMSRR